MAALPWTIRDLRRALAAGTLHPSQLAESALAHANQNASRNTYIWQDAAWTRAEAARAEAMARSSGGPFGDGRPALWGIPVSVKDCFDLAGSPTSCGVHFYRDLNGVAARDSWLVEQLRAAGAIIIGKTHLHALAYGITGENPEYGDCVQPRDPGALTGGSSSGAAASVQEGSAVAAIGTDTGGSVRVPAALCGLAGYRATLGRGDWRGGCAPGRVLRHHRLALPRSRRRAAARRALRSNENRRCASIHPVRLRRWQLSPRLRAAGRRGLPHRRSRVAGTWP